MARRLRIAVSVFFALVAVAFAVLWVRSYQYLTVMQGLVDRGHAIQVTLAPGYLSFRRQIRIGAISASERQFLTQYPIDIVRPGNLPNHFGFNPQGCTVPIWFFLSICTAIAVVPWLPWSLSYSLRTLLIATTLVAIVLELAVWAGR